MKAVNEEIKTLLNEGTSLKNIGKKLGISKDKLDKLIFKIWQPVELEINYTNLHLTNEDWLLNGDKTTYKDLSDSEKLIYDKI